MSADRTEIENNINPNTLLLDIHERLAVIETQNTVIMGEQTEAKESRRLMHSKQDSMSVALNLVQQKVEEISPQVLEHERLRQRISGAVAVLIGLGSIVMIGVGFILKEFWAWITFHLHWR